MLNAAVKGVGRFGPALQPDTACPVLLNPAHRQKATVPHRLPVYSLIKKGFNARLSGGASGPVCER